MSTHLPKQRDVHSSRRRFLKAAAFTGASLAANAASGQTTTAETDETTVSAIPKIAIAGYKNDRVEALIDGRMKVEGCDAKFQVSTIGAMNTHVFSGPRTREVTEVGFSPYMLAFANEGFRDYALLPVFPLLFDPSTLDLKEPAL